MASLITRERLLVIHTASRDARNRSSDPGDAYLRERT
jgi:hypothetical protein